MLHLCYFPVQWKYAQIVMVAKPGKPPAEASSCKPISLLRIMSKVFERLLLHRLDQTMHIDGLLPIHQFGFRNNHSTIQPCHRVVNKIKESIEGKKMCTSVFLDTQQAFDKVWLRGLLYKLKLRLPDHLYLLLKSYLSGRYFQVKIDDELSDYHPIRVGVPQGSVLGPLLYLLYTADIPTTQDTLMVTFADDTAILSSDPDPARATEELQHHLNLLQNWLEQWRIEVNPTMPSQVTFTTRRDIYPPVNLHDTHIPVKKEVKYFGLHLDEKITWKTHIKTKRCQLELKLKNMSWINTRSQLSLDSKLTVYKTILPPIWTYGIEL